MNIFMREMKSHRKSLLFWSIGVVLMVITGMSKYASMSLSGQSMNEMIAQMPTSIKVVFGFGSFDISKASGYYGILFLYLLLMATIHATMLGATIVAKEERDKTSEFLFVKPVSRNTIITAKLLAAFMNIVVLNLVTFISSLVIVGNYSDGETVSGDIAVTMVGMFIMQLLFMVLGSALAAVRRRSKTAAALAAGVLLLTYVLSIAIDLNESLEALKYITPFKYFEAKNIMFGGGFEPQFVILSVVVIAALTMVTYVFYQKRDLNV
jgi:ABC-2 type transport system permease protein